MESIIKGVFQRNYAMFSSKFYFSHFNYLNKYKCCWKYGQMLPFSSTKQLQPISFNNQNMLLCHFFPFLHRFVLKKSKIIPKCIKAVVKMLLLNTGSHLNAGLTPLKNGKKIFSLLPNIFQLFLLLMSPFVLLRVTKWVVYHICKVAASHAAGPG